MQIRPTAGLLPPELAAPVCFQRRPPESRADHAGTPDASDQATIPDRGP